MSVIASVFVRSFPLWIRGQLDPAESSIAIHQEGRIVACSPALLDAGMQPGDDLDGARIAYPQAVFVPRDPLIEAAMWEDILYLLHEISPRLLSLRSGWVLLERFDAEKLRRITRALQVRACISTRRFAAMLGALHAEEGEMGELTPAGAKKLLDESPSRLLNTFGFDAELIERLGLIGHTTIGHLWRLTGRYLNERFGAEGERLFRLLHHEEEQPLPEFQPPPSVAVSYDFDAPVADPIGLLPALDHLVHRAVGELGGLRAQLLSIRFDGWHGEARVSRRVLKEPIDRPYPLSIAAEAILRAMQQGDIPIGRMTIELGGLSRPEGIQGMFFDRTVAGEVAERFVEGAPPPRCELS